MLIELFIFFLFVISFIFILFTVSSLISTKVNNSITKFDIYECGFKSYETGRNPLNIEFFIVAILFTIFDIEAILLIPWLINLVASDFATFWLINGFIGLLILGFIYEIKEGCLQWNRR